MLFAIPKQKKSFVDGLILQIMTFHSYEDVKIVLFTNEKNAPYWEALKVAPHTWSNDKSARFFATNLEIKEFGQQSRVTSTIIQGKDGKGNNLNVGFCSMLLKESELKI